MSKFFSILLFVFAISTSAFAQKYSISGNLKDGNTGEDLIGASLTIKELPGVGVVSNVYGFYSLQLEKGSYTLVYGFIGYAPQEFKIELTDNIKKNIELGTGAIEMAMVEITGEKEDENIRSTEMGVAKMSPKDVESIPVLFGEKDIIKTMQLLPGVKTAGEGNAGFYVRGGAADQNLILLDGAPVYNASHLLGFFSVFNSDAIKDVKLYKGGMPAEYGGRLSSVMDIKMKEGNSKTLSVSGGIGLISSKLTIEAPIVKNKGSFIISGRRTYADLFLKASKDTVLQDTKLYFYDLNLKANYTINDKNRIFLSGYFGRDKFGFGDSFGFNWGNATGTVRWNHIYNDKLFGNTSVIWSDFDYLIEINAGDESLGIGSTIEDINVKQDFDYYLNNNNKVSFGGNIIHHKFQPGKFEVDDDSAFETVELQESKALESALYVQNDQKLGARLSLNYGLRFSNFTQLGPGDIYSYTNEGNVLDTATFGDWDKVTSYNGLEPRLSGTFLVSEESSVKASYARSFQYLHLLSNSTSSSPTDVWIPSSINVKPQIADQVAVGYFRNFMNNTFEFSTEVYYKWMQNAIDYRTGAVTTLNEQVEGELLFGEGRAYGVELFLKKKKGNFTGWVGYTLARSERRFEELNDNSWFAAKQDRTHDISIVLMYNINERLNVSGTWVYSTGNAVTFPSGKYIVDGNLVSYYTERNGYRMPDYHRADVGITLKNKNYRMITGADGKEEKVMKKFESSWNLSVYNVYNRSNAYSISFREKEGSPGETEAVQLTLFRIIPSISYNFKF
jgi:hypothetical protein